MGIKQPVKASNERQPAADSQLLAMIVQDLRADSKLRAVLVDSELGHEFFHLLTTESFTNIRAWLAEHKRQISSGNISIGRNRILNAIRRINSNRLAIEAAERDAERRGTTLATEAMKQQSAGLADIMDAAAEKDPLKAAKLIASGLSTITKVVGAEAKIEGNKLKREDLELARAELQIKLEKHQEHVAERKAAIQKQLDAARNKSGVRPETIEKIEKELKLL
jgi:hypothetical protein